MSHLLLGILFTFLVSFLFGVDRVRHAQFSNRWFLRIYFPLLILIFYSFLDKLPGVWVYVNVLVLGFGQVCGGKFRKSKLTKLELDTKEQIPDLQISRNIPVSLKDEEVAVVLMNMGGPCCIAQVEPFLRRLFNDRLIIRFPFAQSFFADLLIRSRLKEVQGRYNLIGGGSPILGSSMKQVNALSSELIKRGRHLDILLQFNYSYPLSSDTIKQIKKLGKKYILLLSLYPHYSQSTTASNIFYLKEEAKVNCPEVNFIETYSYHLYEGYIQSFVDRIKEVLNAGEKVDDFYLLFSAHGTPYYFVEEGDPYSFLVSQSISRILGVIKRTDRWSISYQSAVGPLAWLKPSTDAMLKKLAERGVKKIIVVPISFVTDHIETLCEIDIEYRHMAKEAGIYDFRMSKAIESHPGFISSLADCVQESLKINVF